MLTAESVHAESARYSAAVLCLPGLWSTPTVWRPFAGYLGHRGWESQLLDVRAARGGMKDRVAALAPHVEEVAGRAVLIGHDAGALLANAAANRVRPAALVMLAPLLPGSRAARGATLSPRRVVALLAGRRLAPPSNAAAAGWLDVPEPAGAATRAMLADDDPAFVRDVVWGRVAPAAIPGVPALVVAGGDDRLLDRRSAEAFAGATGAELRVVEGVGHWLLGGPRWQDVAALVHRWLVQRLGESLLEFYAEAMADRDAGEEPS